MAIRGRGHDTSRVRTVEIISTETVTKEIMGMVLAVESTVVLEVAAMEKVQARNTISHSFFLPE